jgi:hypothetical protein
MSAAEVQFKYPKEMIGNEKPQRIDFKPKE